MDKKLKNNQLFHIRDGWQKVKWVVMLRSDIPQVTHISLDIMYQPSLLSKKPGVGGLPSDRMALCWV